MMHLINTILERALDLKTKSFQENHLQKVTFNIIFLIDLIFIDILQIPISDFTSYRLWFARRRIGKLSLLIVLSMLTKVQDTTKIRRTIPQS